MAPDKSCAEQDIGNEVSRFCGVKTTVPHYGQCALVASHKIESVRMQITGCVKGFRHSNVVCYRVCIHWQINQHLNWQLATAGIPAIEMGAEKKNTFNLIIEQ